VKVLVVDDEPVARDRLVQMLRELDGVTSVTEAADSADAMVAIESARPDVVLLDIRMPGEDGMTFARRHVDLPPIIFTTAFDEYAVDAFDACAVDYLLKPIRRARLEKALRRVPTRSDDERVAARELLDRLLVPRAAESAVRIAARIGDAVHLFDAAEIPRFYAADKYACFLHAGREYMLNESLNTLERRLGSLDFLRVHRAELVSLRHVRVVRTEGTSAVIELESGETARVSRRYLPALRRAVRRA
jgi:two-component system, LytTR family, response regulator AlgR